MRRKLKFLLIFSLVIILLPIRVHAKSKTVVKENALVYQSNNKSIIQIPQGTNLNITKRGSNGSSYFTMSGKQYYISNDYLISQDEYNSLREKSKPKNINREKDLNKANEFLRGERRITHQKDPYTVLELFSDKSVGTDLKYISGYIENFQSKKNTNNEKIKEVFDYLREQGFRYNYGEMEGTQFQTMSKKLTKCYGITFLGARLLDKSGVPYRLIQTIDLDTSASHIYLEVKNDNNKWSKFELTLIVLNDFKSSSSIPKAILEDSLKNPISISDDITYKNELYFISPEIQRGEAVGGELITFTKSGK